MNLKKMEKYYTNTNNKDMKVTISLRSVYYKVAQAEVEVPNHITHDKLHDYLLENEHLYTDKIDQSMSEANLGYGLGMDDGDWTDKEDASEWRYDCEKLKTGGHL